MGGLKNTDILYKIIILQCSSVKRLGKVDNNSTLFNSKNWSDEMKIFKTWNKNVLYSLFSF